MEYRPLRFISEPIAVEHDEAPVFEKRAGCPDRFTWRGETYEVARLVAEWHDYGRRGRMAANMRPTHLATAAERGSWGVGRDHYRVATAGGRVFDIYYDRAPRSIDERKGEWMLYRELTAEDGQGNGGG
jgi:hypothetical protein